MSITFQKGLKAEVSLESVQNQHTARTVGSGSLEVLATPELAVLFERAACKAIEPLLEDPSTTVGTYLQIHHLAATPIGLAVKAVAELVEVNDRQLVFHLNAYDESEEISTGIHHRVLISKERFLMKVNKKLQNQSKS